MGRAVVEMQTCNKIDINRSSNSGLMFAHEVPVLIQVGLEVSRKKTALSRDAHLVIGTDLLAYADFMHSSAKYCYKVKLSARRHAVPERQCKKKSRFL